MDQIRVEDKDGARWIFLRGELDQTEVLHLKPAFDEATEGAKGDVVLDLGGVTFMGTLGIGLIVSTREELEDRGLTLKLARVPAFVERTFEVMSLTEIFARA